MNGTVFKYSLNNELEYKCHYVDNKRHGYSYEYYLTEQNLKRAVNYYQGKKTGRPFYMTHMVILISFLNTKMILFMEYKSILN